MQDLEKLLSRIQTEGVDKAKSEAKAVLGDAQTKADRLVKDAEAKAAEIRAKGEHDAEAFKISAQETLRQAARDVLLGIERDVEAMLSKLLTGNVDASMASGDWVAPLAKEAIEAYLGKGAVEVRAGAKLLDALRAQLAAEKEITLVTDANTGAGFRIRLEGGRVEHDFTGKAVAEALAQQLRPDLAALLK